MGWPVGQLGSRGAAAQEPFCPDQLTCVLATGNGLEVITFQQAPFRSCKLLYLNFNDVLSHPESRGMEHKGKGNEAESREGVMKLNLF